MPLGLGPFGATGTSACTVKPKHLLQGNMGIPKLQEPFDDSSDGESHSLPGNCEAQSLVLGRCPVCAADIGKQTRHARAGDVAGRLRLGWFTPVCAGDCTTLGSQHGAAMSALCCKAGPGSSCA